MNLALAVLVSLLFETAWALAILNPMVKPALQRSDLLALLAPIGLIASAVVGFLFLARRWGRTSVALAIVYFPLVLAFLFFYSWALSDFAYGKASL
jgi:hypothetical protein